MTWQLTAIVSDARAGAARGGLDAAIALDLGYGGWAPRGWGGDEVPEIYRARMREAVTEQRGMVTRLNVQDSDATLLLSFGRELAGAAAFADKVAEQQRKPYLHLVLPAGDRSSMPSAIATEVLAWIAEARVNILHVAGPLEVDEPGIQAVVRDALVWILEG